MKYLYIRVWDNEECIGKVCRLALGLYAWSFSRSKDEKPIAKGIAPSFWKAIDKCNHQFYRYMNSGAKHWNKT